MGSQKENQKSKSSASPRTSDHPSFDVSGPWDTAELVWLRCTRCGCTAQYENGDEELDEILADGFGMKQTHAYCFCHCHEGREPLPKLLVKRG